MKKLLGLTVAAIAVAAAFPAAASAAPSDPAKLAAVTQRDPATGKNKFYEVRPGDPVPADLGVTNLGEEPVDGLVVEIRVLDGLDFSYTGENCWYAVDSNMEILVCEFDDTLAPGATLAIETPLLHVKPDATTTSSIVFRWFSAAGAANLGGAEKIASRYGSPAERGVQTPVVLAERELPLSENKIPLNFAYVRLLAPQPEPSAPVSPAPSAPTPSPSTGGDAGTGTDGDGGAGGGEAAPTLPVTGAQTTTVAAVGAGVLLLGAAGFLVARRRRTRFTA